MTVLHFQNVKWVPPGLGGMERRTVLQSLATGGVLGITGLSGCLSDNAEPEETPTREVVVTNEREETVQVGVRVEDRDGTSLFSHVYELESGKTDETAADGHIETQPASVLVFTPDGATKTWEYTPDTDLECDTQDIGIWVKPDQKIQFYNSC